MATRSHVIVLKFPLATTHNSLDVVGLTGGGAVGTTRGGLVGGTGGGRVGGIGLTVLTGVGLGVGFGIGFLVVTTGLLVIGFTTVGISGINPQVLQHAF